MSAHTPGPWRWSPEGLRAAADGQLILTRPWNVDPATPDARLIVNAPDLLAALREAVECATHTFECKPMREFNARLQRGETVTLSQAYDVEGECDCWKSRAAAALAKAEGRP